MSTILLASLILIPLGVHLLITTFVYYDATTIPLERRKWALITLAIPIFGFFMYLFERGELDYDPAEDPYAGQGYNVHPSRADDFPLMDADSEESRETEYEPGSERDSARSRNEDERPDR